jgi:hypothetical protein
MKIIALALAVALIWTLPAAAQKPTQQDSPEVLHERYLKFEAQAQAYYERIKNLSDFQGWQDSLAQRNQAMEQYQAASAAAARTAQPAATLDPKKAADVKK